MIANNYEILFTRSSPAQSNKVIVDEMPEDLNWIGMVDRLANGDITKYDKVYQLNYIECLNSMAYWHHKDKYTAQINRAIERKYNL
jgi:hypothetical protein